MASYKKSSSCIFLNSLIFSGILLTNIIYPKKSIALNQENIDILGVVSFRPASCAFLKKCVNHSRDNGLEVVESIVEDVSGIENQYKIPDNLRPCHSSKIGKYSIEEHVPIKSISKLFREKSGIKGIAVLGMQLGSSSMKINSHGSHSHAYKNYNVVSFIKTGKTKIFDKISP